MRVYALAVAALFGVAGCSTATVDTSQPAPPAPVGSVVPTGTVVHTELQQTLSIEHNRVGDGFTAKVDMPVLDGYGRTLIPKDAVVHGTITGLDPSERAGEQAALRLNFTVITIDNVQYPFSADVIAVDVDPDDLVKVADFRSKAAIGAATGAFLGAIIGGRLADALIGGALGAGVGTIISLGMGDYEAALPADTDLTLRTTKSFSLR